MSWVNVAMSVAGFVINNMAQEKQSKKQNQLANSMELYKMGKAREANAATEEYLSTIDPAKRDTERQAFQQELNKGLTSGVAEVKKFETPDNFAGKVSGDYRGVRDRTTATNDTRITNAINQLATIGAPGQRDLSNARAFSGAAGRVGAAQSAASNVGGAYGVAINNVAPDPYLNFAGQLVAGMGGALKKKPAATPAPGDYGMHF